MLHPKSRDCRDFSCRRGTGIEAVIARVEAFSSPPALMNSAMASLSHFPVALLSRSQLDAVGCVSP